MVTNKLQSKSLYKMIEVLSTAFLDFYALGIELAYANNCLGRFL